MRSVRYSISSEIQQGLREQGAELTEGDVGRRIDLHLGRVLPVDVGKRVWLRNYGVTMENNKQRDERKGKALSARREALRRELDEVEAEIIRHRDSWDDGVPRFDADLDASESDAWTPNRRS